MLFVRSDKPVDPLTIEVLRALEATAKEVGLAYFIAGATARDILLSNVYGFEVDRATMDLDVAIVVKSWSQFNELKQRLAATGTFKPGPSAMQRMYYAPARDHDGYPVDILPFGSVENPPRTIVWPPHRDSQLNVLGFDEALTSAVLVSVDDGLAIPFASLVSLAALKLLAWADRRHVTSKDALDFAKLLRCYANAGNRDRLYGEASEILEMVGYDLGLAGARLLGSDVRRSMLPETNAALRSILDNSESREQLALRMEPALLMHADPHAAAVSLIDQFSSGFTGDL